MLEKISLQTKPTGRTRAANDLLNQIRLGVVIKGFCLLFDENLDLICGEEAGLSPAERIKRIMEFATKNGYAARFHSGSQRVEFVSLAASGL